MLASGEWIMPADMFPEAVSATHVMVQAFATLSETRDLAERRQIERALQATGGHIIEAARLLGVSRTTMWDKMRRTSVYRPTENSAPSGFRNPRHCSMFSFPNIELGNSL